jgi:1-deoxy-D-xylulose-5-phosphate synthase
MARDHRLVITLEDGVRAGGVGDAVAKAMRDAGVYTPLRDLGVPLDWHPHGTRAEILTDLGLTAADVTRETLAVLASLAPVAAPAPADARI